MSRSSFLKKNETVQNKSYWRSKKQEREIAKNIGGKVTPASGSKSIKGDARLKGIIRLECKTTKNKSFSITLDMIEKIEQAALSADEIPAIVLEYNDGDGKKIKDVAIIPTYALYELLERK